VVAVDDRVVVDVVCVDVVTAFEGWASAGDTIGRKGNGWLCWAGCNYSVLL